MLVQTGLVWCLPLHDPDPDRLRAATLILTQVKLDRVAFPQGSITIHVAYAYKPLPARLC
jgi:hypothetical protein